MKQISDTFPGTLEKVCKLQFINKDDFEKWITLGWVLLAPTKFSDFAHACI